jgi:hypothetical protein
MTRQDLTTAEGRPSDRAPRGRLGRYALWQLRDFALQRGAAMLAIALALAYPVIAGSHSSRQITMMVDGAVTTRTLPVDPVQAAEASLGGVLWPVIILGVLLSVRGLVSDDRRYGYHRFLFAKPVSVTRYYAQSYAVQFAGFLAVVGVLILLFALFLRPVAMMPGLFASAAVLFALVGSVGFLLSTVTRGDWLWLLVTMGISAAVSGLHAEGARWLAPLVVILPPVGELPEIMSALMSPGFALPVDRLLWVLGYGALSVALALHILRRRALPA